MAAQNVALKVVVTPLLVGGASRAGRRFGAQVGGWVVGLPLTSGPVAFFLATDQGIHFATGAAVGMLAGTLSQVAFAVSYRLLARHGWAVALLVGAVGFGAVTGALSLVHWGALATFMLVAAALGVSIAVGLRRRPFVPAQQTRRVPLPRGTSPPA